jgi:N-acetylneuraminic acid mutarotase
MRKGLLSLYFLSAVLNGFSQNSWTKKMSFGGEKRTRAISFAIGDYGYVGMGEDTAEMTHKDLWRYDPVLDSWTQMTNHPGSTRRNAVGVAVGDKGYIGLGADSSVSSQGVILDDWWEYDPVGNSWLQKADYPGGFNESNMSSAAGVYFATAFSSGTKAYLCGGKMGPDVYGTDLWEYNTLTDAWTRLADFPGGDRYQLSSFAIGGKGYVGMGIDHDLFNKDWWQYDPTLDSWIQVSDLPGSERGSSSTFVLGDYAYVVFGSDGGYKDELWRYDPLTDNWMIRANFPANGRKNGIAFTIGDKGYAGTGKGASGKKRSFYQYTPVEQLGISSSIIEIAIYPNPATDYVNIRTTLNNNLEASLYSVQGDLVKKTTLKNEAEKIQLNDIEKGAYILRIGNSSGTVRTEKLLIL